jgi:hypothetical protein
MEQRLIYFMDVRKLCSDKIVVDEVYSRYQCPVIPNRNGRCNGNNCPIWDGLKKPARIYPPKANDGMDNITAAKLRSEIENLDEGRCQRMDHPLEDTTPKEVEPCDHEWEPCNAVKCENCGMIIIEGYFNFPISGGRKDGRNGKGNDL